MDLSKLTGSIWLDGELVPWEEAKVHVLTHTFHYGLGVFEGVRAYATEGDGTCIFRLNEHTDRLFRSAKILQMDMPYDKDTLNEAQREVVRVNGLDEAYLRPMCFLGSEGMGLRADNLKTHVMVACLVLAFLHGSGGQRSRYSGAHLELHPTSREHHHV
jgi:branched-chain amino acid aminotransferase